MTTEKTFFFEYGIALYFLFGFNIQIGKLLANQVLGGSLCSILLEQLKWYRKVIAVEPKLGVS